MILTRFSASQYALAGWFFYFLALVVSALVSPAECGWLTRWNVFDSFPAAMVFVVSLGAFAGAAVQAWQGNGTVVSTKTLFCLLVAAVIIVPFNTHDLSYYFHIGKSVANGINVYDADWSFVDDYACRANAQQVHGVMYGPLAVRFMGLLATVAPGALFFLGLWKLGMLLALWLCVVASKRIVGTVTSREVVTFLSLQPLVLWETVGSGHFDILWVITVLWAYLAARAERWFWVMPLLALGIWIKFLPVLTVPLFGLWWLSTLTKANWQRNTIFFFGGNVFAGLITWWAWYPFWTGTQILTPIILQTKWAVSSVFAAIYYTLRPLADLTLGEQAHWWLTRVVQGGLLLLIIYMLWPLVCQSWHVLFRRKKVDSAWYLFAISIMYVIYVMLWQKSFWPWYLTWLVPFLYLLWRLNQAQVIQQIGRYLSAAPLAFYVIWILNHVIRHTDAASAWWFYVIVVGLIWVYPAVLLYRWRVRNYDLAL